MESGNVNLINIALVFMLLAGLGFGIDNHIADLSKLIDVNKEFEGDFYE